MSHTLQASVTASRKFRIATKEDKKQKIDEATTTINS